MSLKPQLLNPKEMDSPQNVKWTSRAFHTTLIFTLVIAKLAGYDRVSTQILFTNPHPIF